MIESEAKRLRRLYWAEIHFKAARDIAELALRIPHRERSLTLAYGLDTGAIVSYARPFISSRGLGKLEREYAEFESDQMAEWHVRTLKARHMLYGHKEHSREHQLATQPATFKQVHKIEIQVSNDGDVQWDISNLSLADSARRALIELCRFQEDRVHKRSDELLKEMCQHRSFEPGRYVLGENFP